MRVGGFRHFLQLLLSLRIRLAAKLREFAMQLIDDLYDLGHFLLRQEVDLQVEMRTVFGHLRHAVLPNEYRHGEQQRVGTDDPLQPGVWRGIDVRPTGLRAPPVNENPQRDESDGEYEVRWTAQQRADALDQQLNAGDFRVLEIINSREQLEILF